MNVAKKTKIIPARSLLRTGRSLAKMIGNPILIRIIENIATERSIEKEPHTRRLKEETKVIKFKEKPLPQRN
jgi:hypothetical protein